MLPNPQEKMRIALYDGPRLFAGHPVHVVWAGKNLNVVDLCSY